MATYVPRSHSPLVSGRVAPQTHTHITAPITPIHSPHHSVTSTVSSRTPIHTLSIHEYRKQQNTTNSPAATSSGKTLRRKAAAPVLSGLQRDSPIAQPTRSGHQASFRPLHPSQSEQQLHSHRSPFQQQQLADQLIRSQSAEPRTQGGSTSSTSTTTPTGRVRYFNSRKRLPKPSTVSEFRPFSSRTTAVRNDVLPRQPALTAPGSATAGTRSSDTRTAHTASTFSLSRFPQPPHLIDPSFSPPHDDGDSTRIAALNFASTGPETPPATPATYHYRGASFDLVNPHDSLLLHDIITPSRDFGSSEYLSVHTYEESFEDFAEMAPKRALYGDLTAAHAGIMRRAGDSFSSSNLELPLPPTPAAISPNSSTYTSPIYSPESNFAPSPLAIKKPSNESRFSLKQLTRTLTKRLGKNPEKQHGRELQELRDSSVHLASISMDGEFPRPLEETYVPTPQSAYFPISPASPITPTSPMFSQDQSEVYGQNKYDETELPRRYSLQGYDAEPLTSLMPDDYPIQMGRVDDPRTSMSEGHLLSRPYYDDLDSIYPSSSIYTADDRRKSSYQQGLTDARQSNPFVRYSGMNMSSFTNEYNQDNMYRYSVQNAQQENLSSDTNGRSVAQEKTDTISKIIDQYDPSTAVSNTTSIHSHEPTNHNLISEQESETVGQPSPMDCRQEARAVTGRDYFGANLRSEINKQQAHQGNNFDTNQSSVTRRPTMGQALGLPPHLPAPLAPPFRYGETPFNLPYLRPSEMFSTRSSYSYGDTQSLLQISQTDGLDSLIPGQLLQPSSSYSQSDHEPFVPYSPHSPAVGSQSPQTPQEALDQADQIFQSAASEKQHLEKGIPAMWIKRSSGSLLLSKKISNQCQENWQSSESAAVGHEAVDEVNEADWESVGGNSYGVRNSLGSIADYSSSEGTRNSLGLNSDGSLPSWTGQNHSQGPSIYSHPSPIRAHNHPFSSSPPQLQPQARLNTAPESSSQLPASSPPKSRTVPVFRLSTHPEDGLDRSAVGKPYDLAPWADRYAFSDKETQELLASGPNDKIMFDSERESVDRPRENYGGMYTSSSPVGVFDDSHGLERENTFEKLCVIGPKGNLTGTPRGTGMHETGSSVADTSSPGHTLTSSAIREGFHSNEYPGFYASPFPITSSVTQIQQVQAPTELELERTPSQVTLFPRPGELEFIAETSPSDEAGQSMSSRRSTTFQRAQRRVSRTAVPGQTKLRQMILAPEATRKTLSSAGTNFSRIMSKSERPSTGDINVPLHPKLSVETFPTARTLAAHQHSPHLLCPERVAVPEDEERRRKLSWVILAVFCLLPPCIILYRVWGDTIIVSLTKGHLGHCTNRSKKVALIAGIAVNIGIAVAIIVPIVIAHALGAA